MTSLQIPQQASRWLITQEVLPHSHFLHFLPGAARTNLL